MHDACRLAVEINSGLIHINEIFRTRDKVVIRSHKAHAEFLKNSYFRSSFWLIRVRSRTKSCFSFINLYRYNNILIVSWSLKLGSIYIYCLSIDFIGSHAMFSAVLLGYLIIKMRFECRIFRVSPLRILSFWGYGSICYLIFAAFFR